MTYYLKSGFDDVSLNSDSRNEKPKLIVFDMDSTLIDAECIDELARAAGVEDFVSDITRKAMNGELKYSEALIERVKTLKGLDIELAQKAMDEISLMPGAEELLEHIRTHGYTTAMLSGGFSLKSEHVGKRLKIDHVFSNILEIKDGKLTGNVSGPMTGDNSKEVVFEKLALEHGISTEDCVVVGDGANDICIFKKAGYSIAFNPKPILCQYADVVIKQKNMKAIIPVIDSLQ
ncbi:phosphoserine phosphatase [Methanohalophilus levihalophilus]|uniref:phosphoserine phosphatase SerB n=1 Tax=Methanohalophilus levihalophilus TaxID=1431282 RepID=UPI001AE967BB|nr:phosphoserine phosphatase SerB [Methanohalophilus levihalophilus]MBP2031329.1 phosphoserine phosphatase [Methanohalophilus levihalophilus]